ncbi:class I SAM-dependent methyltransferase [Herbaspirillum sp. GCM10030257]|uniref:class I SAM-dependent methyltransferase n=1 Tax=Herbaspirillum sp. GCM10030257 TaxID=3273393 RepID=UPI003614E105
MDRNCGYVSDVEYPAGFFCEQSPAHLNFACILNGIEPIPLDRPFTYFELGFGQGLTSNILAACNPQGKFYAADINPVQVASARKLAAAACLENLTLFESSFAELAEGSVPDLPQFDFITMHGIYTWVVPEQRKHIVNFVDRYLKPGGIVFLGYNAMPGWSSTLPLQRLMLEHADQHPDRSDIQVQKAGRFIERLHDLKAGYFVDNPNLEYRLQTLKTLNPDYLAHEYMNRGWQPLYHADIARDFGVAGLDYAGSADLPMAFPHLYLTPEQQLLINEIPNPVLRETATDFCRNTLFRRDIFVRDIRRMTQTRQSEWLQQVGLALTVLRDTATTTMEIGIGAVSGREDLYIPVFDALETGPKTLMELATLPQLRTQKLSTLAEIAALLTASGQASPFFLCSATMEYDSARRMNQSIAFHSLGSDSYQALASPLLGNGVVAGLVQRLVYLAMCRESIDVHAIAMDAWRGMLAKGCRVTKDGIPVESEEASIAELEVIVQAILDRRVPIWRQLKML